MIRKVFGLSATLREGHDGIFEIRLDGELAYGNGSECGSLPDPGEVRRLLEEQGAEPLGDGLDPAGDPSIFQGLACPLPTGTDTDGGGDLKSLPMADGGCGCGGTGEEKRMSDATTIRERVSRDYSKLVSAVPGGSCCSPKTAGAGVTALAGYSGEELEALPESASSSSFGCGNPVAFEGIGEGETVLDLGSGAGLDLLLAARKVGPSGRVIGVDMTDEMIERARKNAEEAGAVNVEVRKGIIEELPVESSSVDWVVSNCVINLSPEKEKVFAEIARVLKPGGRMIVSDVVVQDLPDWARENRSLYSGCIAGAISEEKYLDGLRSAGLEDGQVRDRLVYDAGQLKSFLLLEVTGTEAADPCSCGDYLSGRLLGRAAEVLAGKIWSGLFYARKPA
ncbi:arsenite methyltransferase [Candidatus Moduliflexota bacterium]